MSEAPANVAGSGVGAVRWLSKGRHVRSRLCGQLGVVICEAVSSENGSGQSESFDDLVAKEAQDAEEDRATGALVGPTLKEKNLSYEVRLADGGVQWYTHEQLEPWTRGALVTWKLSGQRGEIVRVEQQFPPATQPYLVRFEDGEERWGSLDDVRFQVLQRRGTPMSLKVSPQSDAEAGQGSLPLTTLVPGQWRLRRPGVLKRQLPGAEQTPPSSTPLVLKTTSEGTIHGTGHDEKGGFVLSGTALKGVFEARMEYTDSPTPIEDLDRISGAWEIRDPDSTVRWTTIEAGRAFTAGREVGIFRIDGNRLEYIKRSTGKSRRVLSHTTDLLCWDNDSIWKRLKLEDDEGSRAAALRVDDLDFADDPKVSSEKEGGDGVCSITKVEIVPKGSLSIAFEFSCSGPAPDTLKTQLRVDNRILDADRADFSATLAKGKKGRNKAKGKLFFDDLVLRRGSEVSLRYGGEPCDYVWATLVSAPSEIAQLKGGLYCPDNPLRAVQLSGDFAGNGLSAQGTEGGGACVSLSGKTASSIVVAREGRVTTLTLKPYADEDMAKIDVRGPAVIRFTFFKTEDVYDVMEIDGKEYSGDELPPVHFVPEGRKTRMIWRSDDSTTEEGWECTVTSGMSVVRMPGRECDFGALETPWNDCCAEIASRFLGPFFHLSNNAYGLDDFDSLQVVAGGVLILRMQPSHDCDDKDDEDESSDGSSTPLELLNDTTLACLRRAAEARASAVVFVLPEAAPRGVFRVTCDLPLESKDQPPSIPAVFIGQELGHELIDALGSLQEISLGKHTCRFSMVLERPAELDGSRSLAQLCLSDDNVLKAVLGAELARLPSTPKVREDSHGYPFGDLLKAEAAAVANVKKNPSKLSRPSSASSSRPPSASLRPLRNAGQLGAVVARVSARMGVPVHEKTLLSQLTRRSGVNDDGDEIHGEHLRTCLREMMRRLMPMTLTSEALLPHPEEGGNGKVWDYYYKGRILGSGSFGVVRQGWDRFTGKSVALKKMRIREEEGKHGKLSKEDILLEFKLLRDLSHPNLLRVSDMFVAGNKLYLVTELAAGGDLDRCMRSVGKVDECWIAVVIRQVLSACGFLHDRQIVHHDIKPANVLVTTHHLPAPESHIPYVVVADLGLARIEQFRKQEAVWNKVAGNGTNWYMAPESEQSLCGPKTDVYATGIVLFEMLSGGDGPSDINDEGEIDAEDWKKYLGHCSSEAICATRALVAPLVGDRCSCKEALAIPWFWPYGRPCDTARAELADASLASVIGCLQRRICCDFLQRAVTNLLVGQLGREELSEASRIFCIVDEDGDSVISQADLTSFFCRNGGTEAAAREALLSADIHGRGSLRFHEFAAASLDLNKLPRVVVNGAAEKLYKQLSGPKGTVDFEAFLRRFSCTSEDDMENLAALFHRHDRHGDGALTKDEFFGLLGLQAVKGWSRPVVPEPPKSLVRVLRGKRRSAPVEGGAVYSWGDAFSTFGEPFLARTGGRWFYELEIFKSDYPQVGWADEAFDTEEDADSPDGVGDCEHGWGIDGVRKKKWHDGDEPWDIAAWPRPVTLGCALDLAARKMYFSVDGVWIAEPVFQNVQFSGSMFPAASGILAGAFRFASREWTHGPPDATYLGLGDKDDVVFWGR